MSLLKGKDEFEMKWSTNRLSERLSALGKEPRQNESSPMLSIEPSMRGYSFSPFLDHSLPRRTNRIGVPGYPLYPQSVRVLELWHGSSFSAVLRCRCTMFFFSVQTLCFIIFGFIPYSAPLRAAGVPQSFASTLQSLTVFLLTFFIGQMMSKYDTRFENVCKTNGYVTRLTALAAGLYPKVEAEALMRYTNAIMHIYYFLMSAGGMTDDKWGQLMARGMLTPEEVEGLKRQGSPGVVLYSWAVDILKTGPDCKQRKDSSSETEGSRSKSQGEMEDSLNQINMWAAGQIPFQLNLEACIGGTRGLAAKQIAYSLQQPTLVYFHGVYVSVSVFLLCNIYSSGHSMSIAVNNSCSNLSPPAWEGLVENEDPKGPCVSACVSIVIAQHVLLFTFLVLLKAAEHISDAYGNKAYHYDLGVDLDNLWQESINVLKSMDVPRPKLKRP